MSAIRGEASHLAVLNSRFILSPSEFKIRPLPTNLFFFFWYKGTIIPHTPTQPCVYL
jgi:hypothetical protein